MKFNIKTDSIIDISADIIIIAVNDKNQIINKSKLKPSCTTYLSNIISSKDLLGDVGSILLVHGSKDFERIILVRTGDTNTFSYKKLIKITQNVVRTLKNLKSKNVILPIEQFISNQISIQSASEFIVREVINSTYEINSLKTKEKVIHNINICLQCESSNSNYVKLGHKHGEAVALGANLTKDLGNLPPNICTPTYLANTAKKIAKQFKMQAKILDQKQIEK